ncbi:MAG: putative O-succinylbenzoate--CoA ligase [Pseudonocardiales bacterium]|nr:putative O-succinylbenzoate--CoA ligase [Pseudonocardiales bacterium]
MTETVAAVNSAESAKAHAVAPIDAVSIWQLVKGRATQTPDRVVATNENFEELTAADLLARAEAVAAGLFELGIRPGDVVSWQLPSRFDTIVLFVALSRLQAIQNPLIAMLRESEVEFICDQTKSRLLIVPSVFRNFDHLAMAHSISQRLTGMKVLDADTGLPTGDPAVLPPEPDPTPEESARTVRWLFYTSGTTSAPKGAQHTDAGLMAASATFVTNTILQPDDRVASLSPIAHVGGVLHVLSAITTGSRVVITEVFDPASTPEQMSRSEVTLGGSGVPFINAYLRRQREHPEVRMFPTARAFLVGGSPRPPSLHYAVKNELGGVGIVSGYGLTECPYLAWARVDDTDEELANTEGRPVEATKIKLVDADEQLVPVGESGELRVKAPQLMLGYLDSSLDADAFDDEGYFRSGDLAKVDERGYLTITGRIKDVIIRNMENISAREVENLVLTFPASVEMAAIGLPDAETGERVVAVLVPADPENPPTLAELVAHLRAEGLNPRKLPVQIEYVTELPRNAMAKVMKNKLKEQFLPSNVS